MDLQYIMLVSMEIYMADKNRLPTRIPTTSSVTMTDNDSLQRNPLPVSSLAFMPADSTCIHACLGAIVLSSGAV